MNDDPREVLALLNSLGFVGITAEQLKAFMKDLKLYRKIKEHERQQRKEEIRKKIISKQQCMIKEIISEQNKQIDWIENTGSCHSSNSCFDDSLVKVRIKCVSDEKENNWHELPKDHTREKLNTKNSKLPYDRASAKNDTFKQPINKHRSPEYFEKSVSPRRGKIKAENEKGPEKSVPLKPQRPTSAPNLLEHTVEPVRSIQTRSASSARNSTHSKAKSFIRPWRLQPEVQKNTHAKKSDPVAMYQKYQQEWKQMSFPGEAKHTSVRWAVREKMLGTDPHPLPLPKKSASMPLLRKK